MVWTEGGKEGVEGERGRRGILRKVQKCFLGPIINRRLMMMVKNNSKTIC